MRLLICPTAPLMRAVLAQYLVRSLGRGGQRLDLLLERHESLLHDWMLSYVDVNLLWLTWLLCELAGQWLQRGWPQTSGRHQHRNCCTQSLWHLSQILALQHRLSFLRQKVATVGEEVFPKT